MKRLLTSILLLWATCGMGQTNYVKFVTQVGKFEYSQAAVPLPDGSAVLVSHNFTDSVLHLVKVSMNTGTILWDRQYSLGSGGLLRDFFATSLQYTSGGKLLLGGEHHQNGFPNTTYPAVLCFDTSGALLWNLIDLNGDHYGATAAEIFPGRSVIVEGNYSSANTVFKSQLMKVATATGTPIAAKEYSFIGPNDIGFSGIKAAANNSFIVAGSVPSFYGTPFHYDISLTKMDSSMNVLWTHAYRDTIFNSIAAIAPYNNNGWLLLGTGFFDSYRENGTLLMAVDSAGHPLWAKQYSDTGHLTGGYVTHFNAVSLMPTSDGNYLMSGSYEFPNGTSTYQDGVVVKVDTSGNILFGRTYGPAVGVNNNGNSANSVFDIGNGNYFFAGRSGYTGGAGIVFGQDNPALPPRAFCFSRTPGISVSNALSQIRDTTIVLTVTNYTSPLAAIGYNTQTDLMAADTISCTGDAVSSQSTLAGYLAVYPNPAKTVACFEWKGNSLLTNASLEVYDASGRLISKKAFQGSRLVMNTEGFSPGVYFYHMTGENRLAAKGAFTIE